MPRFVTQNAHAPLVFAPLDFQHLRFLELGQTWMRQVERDGDRGTAVGRKPFVRQVKVQREAKPPCLELLSQLRDALGHRALDLEREIRHPYVEQRFVTQFRPVVTYRETRHSKAS